MDDLKNLFTGYWTYLAINAACELELFDKIQNEKFNLDTLVSTYSWDKKSTYSLLSVLKDNDLIVIKDYIELTEKGKILTTNHPESLYYACLHWADEHLNSWQNLSYTIQTGKPAFESLFGIPYFDYLSKAPLRLDAYQKAMNEYAKSDYNDVCSVIDFSEHKTIIDVGGGYGALIKRIKYHNPNIRCILLDLPNVISNNQDSEIEKLSGNFFSAILMNCDAIILSRVIHDWNDEKAISILSNCINALQPQGKIYLIEILTDKINEIPHLLSLNMQLICNSYERTSDEYRTLLEKVGFNFTESHRLNQLQEILVAQK